MFYSCVLVDAFSIGENGCHFKSVHNAFRNLHVSSKHLYCFQTRDV